MMLLSLVLLVTMQKADAPAKADAPKEVVDRMQRFYDRTQEFKADFRQTLTNPVFGRKQVFDGVVRFKKPGKMRWDYQTPEKKLFVSDGKVLWVYEPEDAQAYKQSLTDSTLPTAVAFLFGQGKLNQEFDATSEPDAAKFGDARDVVLRLVPKKPTAHYKSIVLDLNPETAQVKQSFVFDTQGNINQVSFRKVELNGKTPDTMFTWVPPPGTKIVKPDAQAQ
jgi:outer membrane lipoprotein carrier protein